MQSVIGSKGFSAVINSLGAELSSFKDKGGKEYIWQADPVIWARHAPVLFPFVCSTDDKTFTVNGEKFDMSNHGFARDTEFELCENTENSVSYVLRSNEETKKLYPFDFVFTVKYVLMGNKLTEYYITENTGTDDMYFFVGGHPAFNCPLQDNESFEDYYVMYEQPETVKQIFPGKEILIADNTDKVDITRELFANDVFMKDKPNSSEISLRSRKSQRGVKVSFDNKGCIAVWSPYKEKASFVCLEPWSSVPVYCDKTNELTEMPHAIKLSPEKKHEFVFSIEIF